MFNLPTLKTYVQEFIFMISILILVKEKRLIPILVTIHQKCVFLGLGQNNVNPKFNTTNWELTNIGHGIPMTITFPPFEI
jgi:hypothetical protein